MRLKGIVAALWLMAAIVILGAGCGNAVTATTSAPPESTTTSASTNTTAAGSIDPAGFSTTIDNLYMPLKPGTTFVYKGSGGVRIETVVTADIKRVMGVDCVVVSDNEYVNGTLVEATFDWFAQDKDGNVWYFGEDTKSYRGGVVVSTAGAWEAGVRGARPGIIMEAHPEVGDVYQQEYLKGAAEDMAEVLELDGKAEVPYGSFDHVLTTKEWTPLELGVAEEKLYAPGVGLLEARDIKGGSGHERLVEVTTS
jgi:hypothetical protein